MWLCVCMWPAILHIKYKYCCAATWLKIINYNYNNYYYEIHDEKNYDVIMCILIKMQNDAA